MVNLPKIFQRALNTRTVSARLLLLLLAATSAPSRAEVSLPPVIASNMVIQRDRPATIWGWADKDEKVTVEMNGRVVATTTGQGKETAWKVQIPPQKSGRVPDVRIAGSTNALTLSNVLAGEVWVCSGQSNMAMTVDGSGPGRRLGGVLNAEQEVQSGNHPEIRFFTVTNSHASQPVRAATGTWEVCSPKTVGSASAVAYFFGRTLQKKLSVPVGLVIAANAATKVEAWMNPETAQADAEFAQALTKARRIQSELEGAAAEDRKANAAWAAQAAEAKKNNQPAPPPAPQRLTNAQRQDYDAAAVTLSLGVLFNGKIHPLTPMTIGGVIWYQGESNALRAEQYRHDLPLLIEGWRRAFGQPFPFLIVQLAKFSSPVVNNPTFGCWPRLREAQEQVAATVPNCGIATAIDVGEVNNLHPLNKQEVGRRLGLVALKQVYGQNLVAGGPRFAQAKFEEGKAIVQFQKEGADQLVLRGAGGFEIAGENRRFAAATAVVKGNTLEVSAPSVPHPVAVRYAYLLGPETPLFNGEGLPAFPFRSDDWEVIKPNK